MTARNPDTREKLLEFAERCEAATGPDFALDRDIARAMGYCVPDLPTGSIPSPVPSPIWRYTASLDAAMTLVPEGWAYRLSSAPHRKGHAADLWPPIDMKSEGPFVRRADAPTPALALCAAALRARNEQVTK